MTRQREEKKSFFKLNNYYDYTLLFLTIFLVCFGLVMIYSSSSYVAQRSDKYNYDAAFFMKKQAKNAILGVILMMIASKVDYRKLTAQVGKFKLVYIFYIFCVILQMYVLKFGQMLNGKRRWVKFGPLSFQPSDLTKLAIIILIACLVFKAPGQMDNIGGFLRIGVYTGPAILLIAIANLSTAIVASAIVGGMCFVASRRKWYYGAALIAFAAFVGIFIKFFSDGYRSSRIQTWLNIDTAEGGYQIRQGLYAIASGGLTGTGLGDSMQKLGFIPEAQNDMIFSVICEELGIFGAIVVMFLFAMLLYRIYIIALNAPDLFGSMICVGVMIQVAVQVVINVAVVTNSMPSTGIALPFISYGGTSLIIMMAEIGLVLGVSNRIYHKRTI